MVSAMTPDRNKAVRELLAFYQEAGVDALVGETPVDRLAGEAPSAVPVPPAEVAQPRFEARSEARPQASTPPRTISARDLESKGRAAITPPSSDAAVMAAR